MLTLPEAISLALASNRQIASAALDVARAEERLAAARSNRWPVLSVSLLGSQLLTEIEFEFEKGSLGDFPATGPIPAEDTKIGASKGFTALGLGQLKFPISQQYEIGLNVRLSGVTADSAREELRAQKHSIVHDVRRAYYGILQAESVLVAAEESLGFAREVERAVGDRFRAEKALEADQLEAGARLARADASVYSARDSVIQQKEQLDLLLGRALGAEFRVAPIPEESPYAGDLAAARSRAGEAQPKVRQARLQVTQSEFAWRLAKAEYLPDVSFVGSYISPFSVDFLPRNIFTVGLFLQWDVFDAGKRKHDVAEKAHALAQAKLAASETESSVAVDVGNQYRRYEQNRRELVAADLERAALKERLRISQDKYRQELVTAEELLRAQSNLADAERTYAQAVSSFWSARADLERAVGEESW